MQLKSVYNSDIKTNDRSLELEKYWYNTNKVFQSRFENRKSNCSVRIIFINKKHVLIFKTLNIVFVLNRLLSLVQV